MLSSQCHSLPAAMLAHKRAPVPLVLWCSCAMPNSDSLSVGNLCSRPLKITRTIPTQHIKRIVIVCGFHAQPKYLTLRHFSHIGNENPLGTGARTVRGWRDIRQLASTRSDWTEILWEKQWSRLCTHYNNYIFNWGVKGRFRTFPSTCHMSPVLYIPLHPQLCPDAHYTGMPRPAPAEKRV